MSLLSILGCAGSPAPTPNAPSAPAPAPTATSAPSTALTEPGAVPAPSPTPAPTTSADEPASVPSDVCTLPEMQGPCEAYLPRFRFDTKSGSCVQFIYGGCEGNENNFTTQQACEAACKH